MFVCSFFFITTTAAIYICIQTPRVSVIIIVFFIIIRARNGLSAVFFAYSLAYSFPERLRRRVFSMNVFRRRALLFLLLKENTGGSERFRGRV